MTSPLTIANPARRLDAALTLLRLVVGTVFIAHGAQKLFVFGLDGVAGAFGQMGVPMAGLLGPLVAFGEFLGGIALVLGLFTRLASLGLALIMLGATLIAHLPNGFFNPDGVEFTLTLFATALTLALTGAGRFSADALLAARRTVPGTAEGPRAARRRAA
jgi:putative oxidoreductase